MIIQIPFTIVHFRIWQSLNKIKANFVIAMARISLRRLYWIVFDFINYIGLNIALRIRWTSRHLTTFSNDYSFYNNTSCWLFVCVFKCIVYVNSSVSLLIYNLINLTTVIHHALHGLFTFHFMLQVSSIYYVHFMHVFCRVEILRCFL